MTEREASILAWEAGVQALERAINDFSSFALETTLGGKTITSQLERALLRGLEVRIWYVGLSSPELHIARIRARVARGGHDISEDRIRFRYHSSPKNLIRLLPRLTELRVYDNSEDADPNTGTIPVPKLILHMRRGRLIETCHPDPVPDWTKEIMAAAVEASEGGAASF
jgi:predicted ABC-type ATPase